MRRTIVASLAGAAALVAGMALTTTPSFATPTVDAFYSLDGGSTWTDIGGTCPASGTFCANSPITVGNFTFQMSINSNAPGTLTQSNATNSSVQVLNNNATNNETLMLAGGGTGYFEPAGGILWDATSGTTTINSGGTVSTFACLREDNALSSATLCNGASFTTPTESLSSLPAMGAWALQTGVIDTGIVTTPYSLIDVLTITLTPGEQITFSSSAQEIPEPASLALLGSALFGFGVMHRRRRWV